jgi:Methyltransferase domain
VGQRATARRALDMIERHTARGALLDVGCWLGFLLDEARTRGWDTVGLEPSAFPDAVGALERVHDLLAPAGVLWLAVPNAGSFVARALGACWWSVIPTHVHYFTPTSLLVALARAGFAPRERRTDPKAFTARYYANRLGGYAPPVASALVEAAERAGVAGRMVAPDFRDRLALVATRK